MTLRFNHQTVKSLLLLALTLGTFQIFASVEYEKPLKVSELPIGNLLEWTTAREFDSKSFIVEKSTDGVEFQGIGTVEAVGSSMAGQTHRYMDVESGDKTAHYRLREIDIEGTASVSDMISLERKLENNFSILAMTSTEIVDDFRVTLDVKTAELMTCTVKSLKNEEIQRVEQYMESGLNDINLTLMDELPGMYKVDFQIGDEVESLVVQRLDDASEAKRNMASKKKTKEGRF